MNLVLTRRIGEFEFAMGQWAIDPEEEDKRGYRRQDNTMLLKMPTRNSTVKSRKSWQRNLKAGISDRYLWL